MKINRLKINLIFFLICIVFSVITLRLVHLQLVNGFYYDQMATNNRLYTLFEPEIRGVILDRYNKPLVLNTPIYYESATSSSFYVEKKKITKDRAFEVMTKDSDLISIDYQRQYLYPQALSSVLGYIGNVSKEDLLANENLDISDKIGKFGLEKSMQSLLKGQKNKKIYEINAMGQKLNLIKEEQGRAGTDIVTNIDPELSQVSLEAMGDQRGAVVILDANNGEILSLVTTPSFDANVFTQIQDDPTKEKERRAKINEFFTHPQNLFFNRAISALYPPGSTFKLLTALAGLEEKKIDNSTTVNDEGELKVGDYTYANWYFTQFGGKEGEIALHKAIARSNDIYFYKVAEWVGPEKIKQIAELFGLGKKTQIELGPESAGIIPDPEWKQQQTGERWFLGNTYHFGIGQGDTLVTPLQIAMMTQAISNRGKVCQPHLLNSKFAKENFLDVGKCSEVGVLEENLEEVLRGMLDACSAGGTGFPFFEHNTQYRDNNLKPYEQLDKGAVACKTGTSEFGEVVDEKGHRKTHGWFTMTFGTADFKDSIKAGLPNKITVTVLVESDELNFYKEGSKDAGPVAKKIFEYILGLTVEAKAE